MSVQSSNGHRPVERLVEPSDIERTLFGQVAELSERFERLEAELHGPRFSYPSMVIGISAAILFLAVALTAVRLIP